MGTAQYYSLADKAVLLEDGQVQILDPTSDILRAEAQMSKMRPSSKDGESTESNKVSDLANRTRMDDAAADLSRRTGDLGIYSKNIVYIWWTDVELIQCRVLFWHLRHFELGVHDKLHCDLCVLSYLLAISSQVVD